MVPSRPPRCQPALVVLLLLVSCVLAGCGDEEVHPLTGLWYPVEPRMPNGAPPPGFLRFAPDGTVEQFDGREAYRGEWKIEGDQLELSAIEGMPPAPPMTWKLEGEDLVLTMQRPQGPMPMKLQRAGREAPPADNPARLRRLAERLVEALHKRVGEAAVERARERGKGETVTLGSADDLEAGYVTGRLNVPWTLAMGEGEPRTGALQFSFIWAAKDWRLLRVRLADDAHAGVPGLDVIVIAPDGQPTISKESPFAPVIWQAWLDVMD